MGSRADWGMSRADWKLGGSTLVQRKTRWGSAIADQQLGLLARLHRVTTVSLTDCQGITDAGMQELAKLVDLEDLSLDRSPTPDYYGGDRLTDQGLRALKGLTRLKTAVDPLRPGVR